MLHFNDLRYICDEKRILISVSIDTGTPFDKCFLDQIIIDSQDTYIDNGPSSTPVFQYTFEDGIGMVDTPVFTEANPDSNVQVEDTGNNVYVSIQSFDETKGIQNAEITVDISKSSCNIDPKKDILFVYCTAKGTIADDGTLPCNADKNIIVGVLIDLSNIYKYSLGYIREVENTCSIPDNFIDYMLKLKTIQLLIKTGNYAMLVKYWKRYFRQMNEVTTINCNCHG